MSLLSVILSDVLKLKTLKPLLLAPEGIVTRPDERVEQATSEYAAFGAFKRL